MYSLIALLYMYKVHKSLASGQSGEEMIQDQFTRQVRLLVKQSVTEELDFFRQELDQFFNNVTRVLLPEIEDRIIQTVSTELNAGRHLKEEEIAVVVVEEEEEEEEKVVIEENKWYLPSSSDSGCYI